jgi:hypothetical protein
MALDDEEFDRLMCDLGANGWAVYDARPMVKRQLAWDMLPHEIVPQTLAHLGMTPPGPDSQELEHADAHERMIPLLHIQRHIVPAIAIATEVISGVMLEHHEDCNDPSLSDSLSDEWVGEIVRASVVGVLSYLLNERVLLVNDGTHDG